MKFLERKPLRERVATALLAVAVAGLAAAVLEAMVVAQVPLDDPRPFVSSVANSSKPVRVVPVNSDAIQLAADRDPFRPDRARAPVRFGLPPADVNTDEPTSTEQIELIGTVALPEGGGLAMLRWSPDAPRLFRIGQTLHGVTLTDVEPGRATLRAASGATIVLRVAKAGS